MNLLHPESLIFWTTLVFIILVIVLKKYAWKPILNAVKDREKSINNALESAEKARLEMQNLKSDNNRILKEARAERENLLKEAHDIKNSLIAEAKSEAMNQGKKIIEQAKETIHHEKLAAITELKNQVAELTINITKKVIKKELASEKEQLSLIERMLSEVNLK